MTVTRTMTEGRSHDRQGQRSQWERDVFEAAQLCATHLHETITRARTAAYKAKDSYEEGRAETAAICLDLVCEHLDVANTNAARLLDQAGPDDYLEDGIELAQPEQTASALFVRRVIALSAECTSMLHSSQPGTAVHDLVGTLLRSNSTHTRSHDPWEPVAIMEWPQSATSGPMTAVSPD
jgi:hypothetical protein